MRRASLPIFLAVAFGAADQYLGSRGFVLGYWATEASLLSAPWLLVAFFAGWSQPTAKRAVTLGFVCTLAALAGYWTMTLSPVEGAQVSVQGIRGLLTGNLRWLAGGVLTGPLFGWLGYRWRTRRDPASALVAALAVSLEPLAHAAAGTAVGFRGVWVPEIAAGLLMALFVAAEARRKKSAGPGERG